jgi:hypothetical protein
MQRSNTARNDTSSIHYRHNQGIACNGKANTCARMKLIPYITGFHNSISEHKPAAITACHFRPVPVISIHYKFKVYFNFVACGQLI